MAVLQRAPHQLSYLVLKVGYEDGNGDWHEGEEEWSKPVACYASANGSAQQITFADGVDSSYSYEISKLPANMDKLKVGFRVRLTINGEEREYKVKGFQRYQLQCKVWV